LLAELSQTPLLDLMLCERGEAASLFPLQGAFGVENAAASGQLARILVPQRQHLVVQACCGRAIA
jgi:hypothetical protein